MWSPFKVMFDDETKRQIRGLNRTLCGKILLGSIYIPGLFMFLGVLCVWIISLPICSLVWCHERKLRSKTKASSPGVHNV